MAENKDDLVKEVKSLQEVVVSKLDSYNEELKAYGEGQSEVKAALEAENKARIEELKNISNRIDSFETISERMIESRKGEKTFTQDLADQWSDSQLFNQFKTKSVTTAGFEAKTMTVAGSLIGEVIPPTRIPGVVFDPDRSTHVRNAVSVTSTTSNRIYYVRENAYNDASAMVLEAGLKPESSFYLTQEEAPVKKMAATFKLSREMLDDIPYLSGHIGMRAPQKLMLLEDSQLLYGTGLLANLTGIAEVASPFNAANLGVAPASRTRFDVLAWGIQNVAQDEYRANGIYVNTADYWNMLLEKDAEGRYIVPNLFSGGTIVVGGVPVFWSTMVTADDFFIGDWQMGAQIADRLGTEVRFYDQNEDDAKNNLFLVVVEKRLAFPIYRPAAFVHDNFTIALAAT